jgi:hypothetical protein
MFTDSETEFWFAVIAYFISNISAIGFKSIGLFFEERKIPIKLGTSLFILIGAYTALNAVMHMDWIPEIIQSIWNNPEKGKVLAGKRRGTLIIFLFTLWPIVAFIMGVWCTVSFTHIYKNTKFWQRRKIEEDE